MFNPVNTYRIQFHKDFKFDEFERTLPYLKKLGIKTIYASPIFQASPGSMHGYDVTNPNVINPEIGDINKLKSIFKSLKAADQHWIQDVVPNHMAFHSENIWLMDVLEKGPRSRYVDFFDITWSSPLYNGRLMVPFLGSPIEEMIKNGELTVELTKGNFVFRYFDNTFPLHLKSYKKILSTSKNSPESISQLIGQIETTLKFEEKEAYQLQTEEIKDQLKSLATDKGQAKFIKSCINHINKSPQVLQETSDEQVYQLCHWQETNEHINFRRFFTINGLICLNIQNPNVFETYHKLIFELLNEEVFKGLRIDHVDGMNDPRGYLEELRSTVGKEVYISVEKILEHDEKLPKDWPIQGNTGYDFLSDVNNLFSNNKNMRKLTEFYHKLTGDERSVEERIYEKKSNILYNRLAGELDNLTHLFFELNLYAHNSLKAEEFKKVIAEFLILCPVYRYYGNELPLSVTEKKAIKDLLNAINDSKPELKEGVDILKSVWLEEKGDEEYNKRAAEYYKRVMQFTGPLMAKGVEDTLMYTYSRFIGHNEVGDSPAFDSISASEFHERMRIRQEEWPLSMNATSTHDTKRGEDVRMRLAVLTDLADEWMKLVDDWKKENEKHKTSKSPDKNDEYFLYQTILGAWPMPGEDADDFDNRIEEYITKALREAKRHSNWTEPDEEYEKGVINFSHELLNKKSSFLKSFAPFHKKVADLGIINSLSQVVLKYTCPGVPDLYQGCELWDLSLVDPDNRRPVDYTIRENILSDLESDESSANQLSGLWGNRYNGNIKLWLTSLLLNQRQNNPELFMEGEYIPLEIKGKYKEHVLAFCRKHNDKWLLVIVPIQIGGHVTFNMDGFPTIEWENTQIILPDNAPDSWIGTLSGTSMAKNKKLKIESVLHELPFAVMEADTSNEKKREAGVLLHITSLPSPFGIGDLGPEAYHFADFLYKSGQRYWQLLPLNPTSQGTAHSPYSSNSSMAGNPLLISPEELVKDGLLDEKDLKSVRIKSTDEVSYEKAEKVKHELLTKAFKTFVKNADPTLKGQFKRFAKRERHWLDDYALYTVLKESNNGKPWYEWPGDYKIGHKAVLKTFAKEHKKELKKVKFIQFLFSRQWHSLKKYCNKLHIKFFGDLPFYISHDSVDVWAHPEIFKLDRKGRMAGIAGVPPDYFNSDGQLWGMPVFQWKILKKQKYNWWVVRIEKNIQLYDLLRLDHFRAFEDFWEVPAGEKTAINGTWKKGPGIALFKRLEEKLGNLPFVAEDLGEITEEVYKLRDTYNFPGMKVLQFAFGDDLPHTPHIPHNYTDNYIAYTGTHDNNTTVGWFRKDCGKTEHKNLTKYTGMTINEDNVHDAMIRMVYGSVARIAIIPMQDILGLDENSRMNMPATVDKNWFWRLKPSQLTSDIEENLKNLTSIYNRNMG